MIRTTDKASGSRSGLTIGEVIESVKHLTKGQQAISIVHNVYCTYNEWEEGAIRDLKAHQWNWSEESETWTPSLSST